MMQSLFSLAQLVGGLLCGPMIDVYGARWGMSVAFLSGAVSYAMTALSTSCARAAARRRRRRGVRGLSSVPLAPAAH